MTVEAQKGPPRVDPRTLIVILGTAGFASSFNMRLLDPVVPDLARAFERGIAEVALFSTVFSLAYALGQPFLGPVGDAVGKARTIRWAAFVLSALLAVSAFAATYDQMMALRLVSGIAAGGIIPVALAAIGDRVPMAERQVAIARFLVAIIVGQMAGSFVSGIVADIAGWRAVFAIASVIAAGAGIMIAIYIKPRIARPQVPSVPAVLANYREVFSNPRTLPLFLLVGLQGLVAFGSYPFIAGILSDRAGTSASAAGLVVGASGIGGLVYGILVTRILSVAGGIWRTRLGGIGMGCALLLFALPLPWWTAIAFFFAHGFSFYLIHNTLQTHATELSTANRGAAVALFAACFFLGNGLGPVVMGLLKTAFAAEVGLVMLACGAIAVGFVAPILLGLRKREA